MRYAIIVCKSIATHQVPECTVLLLKNGTEKDQAMNQLQELWQDALNEEFAKGSDVAMEFTYHEDEDACITLSDGDSIRYRLCAAEEL